MGFKSSGGGEMVFSDVRSWLDAQRLGGPAHGFECVGVEALSRMWSAAKASERGRIASLLMASDASLLLMAGEMTAGERRTVRAVLNGILSKLDMQAQ